MATFLGYSNFNGRNGDKFSADLLYDILERNIAGNYTIVRLYGYIRSWGYSGSGSYAPFYINGVNSGGFNSISANQYSEVARRDIRIDHNDSGAANLDWSLLVDTNWTLGDASANGSLELPTIPRASVPTSTSANIEDTITIYTNRKSTAFTHDITYSFGSLSGSIASGVTDSCQFKLPESFYSQIPNNQNGIGTIKCTTYNESTKIGDTQTCTFNAYTNQSKCLPNISIEVKDINEKSIALTGNENKLIKFVSNAKVILTSSAKNSATIKSNSITNGTQTVSGISATFLNVESGYFKGSTIDSRNYSNIDEKTLEVVPYVKLSLNFELYRPEQTGSQIKARVNGNFFSGNFGAANNTLTLKFRCCEKGGTLPNTYTTLTSTINEDNTFSGDLSLGTDFDYQKAYDFEIIAEDKVTSIPLVKSISQGISIMLLCEKMIELWGKKVFDNNGNLYLPEDMGIYSGETPIITHDSKNKEIIIATNESNIVLRPNGYDSKDGQVFINKNGELYLPEITRLFSGGEKFLTHSSEGHQTVLAANGSDIYFRPNGADSTVAETYITPSGNMNVAGTLYSNAYCLKDGNKAIVSSSVHIANMVKSSKVYLELGTNSIDGFTAWGIDAWASDKRLKNSIKDTKVNALDIIMQMKHHEFKYNHSNTPVKIGYVADELQKIDDEMVFEVGEKKLKQPKESYIIPLLSKAIQEQQEQINELKKEIESLKKGEIK